MSALRALVEQVDESHVVSCKDAFHDLETWPNGGNPTAYPDCEQCRHEAMVIIAHSFAEMALATLTIERSLTPDMQEIDAAINKAREGDDE